MATSAPPPNPNDLGKGPMIMGVTWMMTSISVIVVALRFYVRTRPPTRLGLEDWLMAVAVFFELIAQSITTRAYHFGLGKHDIDLSYDPDLVNILKYVWLQLPFGVMVSIFARLSITVLLIRIFNRVTWLKVYYIALTILQTIGGILVIVTVFAQATPVQALWNPMLPAKRWDPRIQLYTSYTAGAIFAFSDLTYGLFPVLIVWKLQMPLNKKIGLASILALSMFTCVAAAMKVVVAQQASGLTVDVQYHTVQAFPWTYAEQCLVIILGSVPAFGLRILSINFSSFRKLASQVKDWSRKSFDSTRSSNSDLEHKAGETPSLSGRHSDTSSRTLITQTDFTDKTITRSDDYAITYVPKDSVAEDIHNTSEYYITENVSHKTHGPGPV